MVPKWAKQHSDIVLGDQDVQITLRRLSQALAVTDLNALANPDSDLERSMNELFGGANPPMPDSPPKSQAESKQELTNFVEAMKSRDKVRLQSEIYCYNLGMSRKI